MDIIAFRGCSGKTGGCGIYNSIFVRYLDMRQPFRFFAGFEIIRVNFIVSGCASVRIVSLLVSVSKRGGLRAWKVSNPVNPNSRQRNPSPFILSREMVISICLIDLTRFKLGKRRHL